MPGYSRARSIRVRTVGAGAETGTALASSGSGKLDPTRAKTGLARTALAFACFTVASAETCAGTGIARAETLLPCQDNPVRIASKVRSIRRVMERQIVPGDSPVQPTCCAIPVDAGRACP